MQLVKEVEIQNSAPPALVQVSTTRQNTHSSGTKIPSCLETAPQAPCSTTNDDNTMGGGSQLQGKQDEGRPTCHTPLAFPVRKASSNPISVEIQAQSSAAAATVGKAPHTTTLSAAPVTDNPRVHKCATRRSHFPSRTIGCCGLTAWIRGNHHHHELI